ncbi:MAG: L,D-transpeptidase family protein, partial [Novosphingobium sp.]
PATPALAQKAKPAAAKPQVEAPRPASGPFIAVVSLRNQNIAVFDNNGLYTRSPISSGRSGFETPRGIFSIIQKNAEHFSNLYDDAPMPFMQRITWSGVALHAGNLPGYPASHGCIRMPHSFAQKLFDVTPMATRVIVTSGAAEPVAFSHPRLFSPTYIAPSEPVPAKPEDVAPPMAAGPAIRVAGTMPPDTTAMRLGAPLPAETELPPAPVLPRSIPPAVSARLLDAQRVEAHKTVAARNKALQEAKALHAAKAREVASVIRGFALAEKQKAQAERRLNAAQVARAAAKTEAAAVRAEEAEVKAQEAIDQAVQALATGDAPALAAKADIDRLAATIRETEAALTEAQKTARALDRKAKPISVFVSRKTQRVYLRQGFEPVLDMPITIKDPRTPIGTFVFTVMGVDHNAGQAKWTVVAVTDPAAQSRDTATGPKRGKPVFEPAPAAGTGAARALDRIELPPAVLQRIAESMRAGSSFIISDEAISPETGKGTDFIIETP